MATTLPFGGPRNTLFTGVPDMYLDNEGNSFFASEPDPLLMLYGNDSVRAPRVVTAPTRAAARRTPASAPPRAMSPVDAALGLAPPVMPVTRPAPVPQVPREPLDFADDAATFGARMIADVGNNFLGLGRRDWNTETIRQLQSTPQFGQYVQELAPLFGDAAWAVATQNLAQQNGLQGDLLSSGFAAPVQGARTLARQQAQISSMAGRNSNQLEAMAAVDPAMSSYIVQNPDGTTTNLLGGQPALPTVEEGISATDQLMAGVMSPQAYLAGQLRSQIAQDKTKASYRQAIDVAAQRATAARANAQAATDRMRERLRTVPASTAFRVTTEEQGRKERAEQAAKDRLTLLRARKNDGKPAINF
jgi:hypothetical protein